MESAKKYFKKQNCNIFAAENMKRQKRQCSLRTFESAAGRVGRGGGAFSDFAKSVVGLKRDMLDILLLKFPFNFEYFLISLNISVPPEYSHLLGRFPYFVFSCSLLFLELIREDADEAREELKLFRFPSSAFTWKKQGN